MTTSKKIYRKCLECNKDFYTYKAQIDNGCGKYCCRKCFISYFAKHFKPTLGKTWKHTKDYRKRLSLARMGKNNPMYRHGGYSGKKRRGLTEPQKQWRKKILIRDRYTCKVCNKRGGELQVHHIVPWADSIKLRFVISNGATLCIRCHKILHDTVRCSMGTGVRITNSLFVETYQELKEVGRKLSPVTR